jgi:hypothetical protein
MSTTRHPLACRWCHAKNGFHTTDCRSITIKLVEEQKSQYKWNAEAMRCAFQIVHARHMTPKAKKMLNEISIHLDKVAELLGHVAYELRGHRYENEDELHEEN